MPLRPEGGLGPVAHPDPLEDPREVRLDGPLAYLEAPRDDLVGQPLRHHHQHLLLAWRQLDRRTRLAPLGEQLARGSRRKRRLAGRGGVYAAQELLRLRVLEEVAGGAGVEGVEDPRAIGERGEHHHLHLLPGSLDAASRLDPVEARHLEVHEDHVGVRVEGKLDALCSVGRDSDQRDVLRLLQELGEPGPQDRMVVDHEHADHWSASSKVTSVPRPASERTSSLPSRSATRSSSRRNPRLAPSAARSAAGSKPRPSSRTASTTEPFERWTVTATRLGSACLATLRSASWAPRKISSSVSAGSARSAKMSDWTATPRAESGASRSETAASRPDR